MSFIVEGGIQCQKKTGGFLTAKWRYLAMINYEIDLAIIRPFVPSSTKLDSWQGKTFVGMVGFLFLKTKLLSWPVPFHRNFEEVNLRCPAQHSWPLDHRSPYEKV